MLNGDKQGIRQPMSADAPVANQQNGTSSAPTITATSEPVPPSTTASDQAAASTAARRRAAPRRRSDTVPVTTADAMHAAADAATVAEPANAVAANDAAAAASATRRRRTTPRTGGARAADMLAALNATQAPSAESAEQMTAPSVTSDQAAAPDVESDGLQQVRERHRRAGISPGNTVFVSLCFEGPDVYSTAGGLGTRVAEFTESLAGLGYETHLIFVGDPDKPAVETLMNGKLHLKRWSQWVSRYYPNGVYDGEEQKLYDYNDSVPYHVLEQIATPAIAQGKMVVIIGEDWHTAEAICRTSDLLHWFNLRHRCVIMWNCNSLMSLHRINWGRLNYAATITTVSRYMKHRLWDYNVNPLSIPNGIPNRYLQPVDAAQAAELRTVMQRGDPNRMFLFKIGRFDPDKRWLMAVEAVARLKYSGHAVSMVVRGGIEPHGGEVLNRARHLGLHVRDIEARRPSPEECIHLMRDAGEADIYNLRFFVPADFVRTCYAAADATLANSGHEPFGLVGLEVMAAEGIAFTGSTGEDYAISFENAVALETEDPDEIVGYLLHMAQHPEERDKIRAGGKQTAAAFTWEEVIDNLVGKLGYLARKQSIVFA